MAGTFLDMYGRVITELRRSNLATEAKQAINDAIDEAAKTRFYFNEMLGKSFSTVIGTEYYDDMGFVEIDAAYYTQGSTRYNLGIQNQLDANDYADGNALSGSQLERIARYGGKLRIYPIPSFVTTIYLDGFGKLTPSPLVADADANAWLTDGEQYIRALAKRNLLRDVIRDYGEARVVEAVSDDYKQQLVELTTLKGTNLLRGTKF